MKLNITEIDENKIIVKETDPDKVVSTTFKIGVSKNNSKAKQNLNLPHFDKRVDIGEEEEKDEEGNIILDDQKSLEDELF